MIVFVMPPSKPVTVKFALFASAEIATPAGIEIFAGAKVLKETVNGLTNGPTLVAVQTTDEPSSTMPMPVKLKAGY